MKTGKTTKLVDRYIQELFTKGVTYVYEGRNKVNHIPLTKKCFKVFKKRMFSEHESISFKHEYLFVDGIWCYKVQLL